MSKQQRCPACDAWVDERNQPRAGPWRCAACGMRFSAPRKEGTAAEPGYKDDDGLGIHPALARKYRRHATPAAGIDVSGAAGEHTPPSGATPPPTGEGVPPGNELDVSDEEQPTIQLSPSLVDEGAGETDEPLAPRGERTRPLRKQDDPLSEEQASGAPAEEGGSEFPLIEGYTLSAVVGKGAMGCVYRGVREATNEPVAIKLLAKELAARPDFIARFEREAAALKAVDHEGVVSVLDRGSSGEHHYIAMPFVEGESMRRVLGKGGLQPIRALGFMRQICRALGAAHARKVIHRDLKPENILVQRVTDSHAPGGVREKLILVDFGLAGMGEDDPHPNLTKSRMTMGTVNYMAPEQRTDAKRVGPPADVYAAGVILYELLTGDLPLGRFKMPTARTGLEHLPKLVDECVGRALDRDPEQRYPTCLEMDGDLAAIERALEAQASRDTVVGRVGKDDDDDDAPTNISSASPGSGRGAGGGGTPLGDTTPERVSAPASSLLTGSEGPQWVTAPPWVKRPLLVWGTLALLVGGAIGVWTSPDDDAPWAMEGGARVEALGAAWQASDSGWVAEGDTLVWRRTDEGGPTGRALDAVASEAREGRAQLAVSVPTDGAAFSGVVLHGGNLRIGFAVSGGRQCAVFDDSRAQPALKPLRCAVPQEGPVVLTLVCDGQGAQSACRGRVGAGPMLPLTLPEGATSGGPWRRGLVCAGLECTFRAADSK
jgi:serine/threonine protein kinase